MNNRVIIVTELFWPEEDATSFILTEISSFLNKDYEVLVVSGPKFYRKTNYLCSDNIDIKVKRVRDYRLSGNSLFVRSLNSILLSFLLFFKAFKEIRNTDIILTVTNPPLNIILIGILSWIKKNKSIIIVHDVFPDNLSALGVLKKNGLIFNLISKIFIYFLGKFNTIITLGVDMKELITSKIPKHSSKVVVIPNWSNLKHNIKIKKPSKQLNLFYTGNIGRVQNIERLIDLYQKANNLNLKLHICGEGSNRKNIDSIIKNNSFKNIILRSSFRRSEQEDILKECDIAIITLLEGMKGLAYPSKYYSYLSNGKPILFLGDKNMDIAKEIKYNNIGWALDYSEPNLIIDFFKNTEQLYLNDFKNMSKNCIYLAKNKYSKEIILQKYNLVELLKNE